MDCILCNMDAMGGTVDKIPLCFPCYELDGSYKVFEEITSFLKDFINQMFGFWNAAIDEQSKILPFNYWLFNKFPEIPKNHILIGINFYLEEEE